MSFRNAVLALSALLPLSLAQTYSECNPLNSTCPPDAALGTTYNNTWNAQSSTTLDERFWNITAGASNIGMTDNGALMSIIKQGDSVTIQSTFYIFWGQVEIMMQAAKGQGVISTVNLLSDDLDEIDWEIMGGNHTHVETNYYGHGNLSQHFATYPECAGAQDTFHNYTINWNQDRIQWILDSQVVRTIPYAASGVYPQSPMMIKMGIWAAGAPGQPQGTIDWAGGKTDFKKAPFTMSVKSIKIVDGSTNVTSYAYGDRSGSWQSIKQTPGQSVTNKAINNPPPPSVSERFNNLSMGVKAAIIAIIAVAVVMILVVWSICWRRMRKAGREERRAEEERMRMEKEQRGVQMHRYSQQMKSGAFAQSSAMYA